MVPIIMHLDMNSYFASVEQQDHSAWRGKPVGVCEHLGGIIIAASVEAKKWGIKTGTPVWEARKAYPKIILTPTSPHRYRFYTKKLIKLVEDYTDQVEVYSIDEVFLDLTKACNIKFPISNFQFPNRIETDNGCRDCDLPYFYAGHKEELMEADPFVEAERIGREIKKRMKTEVGDWLRCSIGIGTNKLVAKIASDMQKPDGMVVIKNEELRMKNEELGSQSTIYNLKSKIGPSKDAAGQGMYLTVEDLYYRLSLTDIPGIGARQERNLNELGIKTLIDLKNYPKSKLVAHFGLPGYHLYNMGQLEGSFKSEVDQDNSIKSIGHMYTLPKEYRTREYFEPVLYKLSEMVARRLRKQGLWGNVLHFFVSSGHREGFGKSEKLGRYLDDGREIFLEAKRIFKSFNVREFNFKLVGITMAGLSERTKQQSLFGVEEKIRRIDEALDKIDEKYGDFTVSRFTAKQAGKVFHDSIGFGRIKELGRTFQARNF